VFELINQVPVVGQAYGLTKTAMRVYNSTDPISAVKNATLSIIEDCAPPQVKYPIKCGILLAQLGLAISSGGNPWAVAMAIGSARQIIE
jgi:hypothetical protein